MSHPVTPPPAVAKSKDGFAMMLSIASVLFLMAAVVAWMMTNSWTLPIALSAIAVLATLAAGIRLFKERKNITQADMRGEISEDSV